MCVCVRLSVSEMGGGMRGRGMAVTSRVPKHEIPFEPVVSNSNVVVIVFYKN